MSDAPTPLLEIRGLAKGFPGEAVLTDIHLAIPEGTVTTLIGKSGSGKTVLLKCIAGLMEPDRGEILFQGEPIHDASARKGSKRARWVSSMSYLFQGDALFSSLTAWENVALPLREGPPMNRQTMRDRVGRLFDSLDLGAVESKYPGELSGGMRRRVALARALVTNPEIVLFDEPTTGLDPLRRNAVLELILKDREQFGFTALVVSHDVPECLYISDQVALLENGRVVTGAPWELFSDRLDAASLPFLENEQDLIHRVARVQTRQALEEAFPRWRETYATLVLVSIPETGARRGLAGELALPSALRQLRRTLQAGAEETSPLYGLTKREYVFGAKQGLEVLLKALRERHLERDADVELSFVSLDSKASLDACLHLARQAPDDRSIKEEALLSPPRNLHA